MPAADRRAERRFPGEGHLTLAFEDPAPQEISGILADYSASGFRAIHSCPNLHSGQEVRFRHAVAEGKARVMWNRILDNKVETGFLILGQHG